MWRRCIAGLAFALLAVLLWGGPAGATADTTPEVSQSLAALGDRVCIGRDGYCASVWSLNLARGAPFNVLISEACLHVRYLEGDELAGIRCLLAGIAGVSGLSAAALAHGRPSGAIAGSAGAPPGTGRWRERVLLHFAGIAGYCDRTTPVIFDYFDCVREGVLFYEAVLRVRGTT